MPGYKPTNSKAVTVTVRPDGSYYVEKAKTTATKPQVRVKRLPTQPTKPLIATVTGTLKDVAGMAAAVKAVAPNIGPYGVLAAVGFGVLNHLMQPQPRAVQLPVLRQIRFRRMPK